MAVSYKITGKKGYRKVIKNIDISDDSYKAIKCLIARGAEMSSDINYPSLDEVYEMFGGNCYGALVSMAIENLIGVIVHQLEDKGFLCVKGEDAYYEISNVILPMMCYTTNGEEYTDQLQFFNTNEFEICDSVRHCLIDEKAEVFVKNFMEALNTDKRPAGEVATGILMYIANDNEREDNNEVAN